MPGRLAVAGLCRTVSSQGAQARDGRRAGRHQNAVVHVIGDGLEHSASSFSRFRHSRRWPGFGPSHRKILGYRQPDARDIQQSLQTPEPIGSPAFAQLETRFNEWNSWTIDVPGKYFLESIDRLYKRNALAEGGFAALGQAVDLAKVRTPMYLIAGRDDEVVAPQQLFALTRLAGTPPESLHCVLVPSDHLRAIHGQARARTALAGHRPLDEGDVAVLGRLKA